MRTYAFIALALTTAACSADQFHSSDDAGSLPDNAVNGGDGGTSSPDVAVPPGCDATKLPADDKCVVNDGEGIFVSSSKGLPTNDGTQAHPLSSIDAAITLAKSKKGYRVYACAEKYAEQVNLQDGVSVFGYFDCPSWTVSKSSHATITSPASPAASASNITTATRVEAVDIVSPDFTDKSQSSIALLANNAPGLTIANATIHAGTGGKGADGASGITLTDSGSKNGGDAWADGVCLGCTTFFLVQKTGQTAGGSNTCVGETGHDPGPGGAGGNPGEYQSQFFINGYIWNTVNNDSTTGGFPTSSTTQTAQGGSVGIGGSSGAPGANGTSGQSGIDFGVITSAGYAPSDGTLGVAGSPGQGGGGSGGFNGLTSDGYNPGASTYQNKYAWGEAGAAGGSGGCPGLAGQIGHGGGASIAIIALANGLTLDTVMVESSKGGDGGMSGAPSAPTAGGFGGKAAAHSPGAGNGGAGGFAGVSGNGAGGPSVGIAYNKVKPTLSASKVTQGAGGSGVAVRMVNGTQMIPASDNGMSTDAYMFGQ